jgi:hypothetical protein
MLLLPRLWRRRVLRLLLLQLRLHRVTNCTAAEPHTSIRQHTSTYVGLRPHTSAYVSIRQHTSAYVSIRQHTSAYVSIPVADALLLVLLQHQRSPWSKIRYFPAPRRVERYEKWFNHRNGVFGKRVMSEQLNKSLIKHRDLFEDQYPSCIRQHTSAYVSIRQHTSADVSRR